MKSLGLLLGSLLLLGGISRAQTSGSVTGTSPVSLDVAAAKSFDYLIAHCTCQPPRVDFWKNPQDAGVGSDQNGWQGAQSMQSAVINYECTHDDKYLKVIQDFANWTTQRYGGKNNLTLCQTWPAYDFEKEKGVGQSLPHFCMWDDDAGWVMNMYLQFYQYTKQSGFLDDAYQTLLNGDKQWGVDFQRNSRGLHYKDHEDHFPIYMAAQLIGALGFRMRSAAPATGLALTGPSLSPVNTTTSLRTICTARAGDTSISRATGSAWLPIAMKLPPALVMAQRIRRPGPSVRS